MLLSAAKLTDFRWIGTFVYRDYAKITHENKVICIPLKNTLLQQPSFYNQKK
jgi:hypothetical protein